MHTLLICDTEPIAIEGLRSLLAAGGPTVVAAEESLLDAMDAARELGPSIIVLDKGLGTHAVLDWLHTLRRLPSSASVVVWGTPLTSFEGLRFIHAGATGVVRKSSSLDSIRQCVRTVAEGGTWMENDMLCGTASRQDHSQLTLREAEVAELVRQGMTNKEVARNLGICVGTVKIHLKHIFEKAGVRGRYNLAAADLKERCGSPGSECIAPSPLGDILRA